MALKSRLDKETGEKVTPPYFRRILNLPSSTWLYCLCELKYKDDAQEDVIIQPRFQQWQIDWNQEHDEEYALKTPHEFVIKGQRVQSVDLYVPIALIRQVGDGLINTLI